LIVFADANSIYRPDAIRMLARNFADPRVGYVTGRMIYVSADGSVVGDGCSAYMRYENRLRAAETRLGSIVGVDGGIDAVRTALYRPMRADQLPDFVLPLSVVGQGFRVVFEPEAYLTEETLAESSAELRMRIRVSLRALWALRSQVRLLNPFAYPVFAWQLWSHKLLRYLSFIPLVAACVLNVALLTSGWMYGALFVGQVLFWLAAFAGSKHANWPIARMAFYFLLLNVACAVALARYLRGEQQVIWQPRVG
jgi:cellulose synthase/poly-beta-1,6-N-acetylglucosamine synthase-like glycosyltransferase